MQIALEEALRKDNPGDPGHPTYACCKLVGLSQVFTPAANAITEIPVNFRVKQSLAPEESGYDVDDHLSLSVLNGNVPIPAAIEPNASVGIWYPAWQVIGEERASVYGTSGLQVLMNAEWNPLPGAAPGGAAGAPQGPAGIVSLTVPQAATVRNGVALFPLVCNLDAVCRGILRLQSLQAAGAASLFAAASSKPANGVRKPITYATASFAIDPHASKKVKVTLKPAGKRLLRKHPHAKVWLNVTMKGGAASVAPTRVTLNRAPRR